MVLGGGGGAFFTRPGAKSTRARQRHMACAEATLTPCEATEMVLATAMAVAAKHREEHGVRNAVTLILPGCVKTTSVEQAMAELRGGAAMSEGDLAAWQSNVERLHHTVTSSPPDRCWFVTRSGDRFDVWHVPLEQCAEAYRAYLAAATPDDAARRIQGALRGGHARRRLVG